MLGIPLGLGARAVDWGLNNFVALRYEAKELLEKIIEAGVKGLEVHSSYHNETKMAFYKEFAINNNLVITCGSDFHGKLKPSINIGGISCEDSEDLIIKNLNRVID